MKRILKKRLVSIILVLVVGIGLIMPQRFINPVEGADKNSYNSKSYWFYPWGKSGTHKGVDIFAKEGTRVNSSTDGLVIFTGEIERGGNVVLVLGPKWRVHYYAHLKEIDTHILSWRNKNDRIGTVGTTGNAKGKSPHLHYSIVSIIPHFWRIDGSKQGWKKAFYLNPIDYLKGAS